MLGYLEAVTSHVDCKNLDISRGATGNLDEKLSIKCLWSRSDGGIKSNLGV